MALSAITGGALPVLFTVIDVLVEDRPKLVHPIDHQLIGAGAEEDARQVPGTLIGPGELGLGMAVGLDPEDPQGAVPERVMVSAAVLMGLPPLVVIAKARRRLAPMKIECRRLTVLEPVRVWEVERRTACWRFPRPAARHRPARNRRV